MPPHLHPRSRATSLLFAGTLLASFAVVAIPHIWPCPVPGKQYLDGEIVFDENGRAMRRVRRAKKAGSVPQVEGTPVAAAGVDALEGSGNGGRTASSGGQTGKTLREEAEILRQLQAEATAIEEEKARRPCPVPKPKGFVGRWLGFEEGDARSAQQANSR